MHDIVYTCVVPKKFIVKNGTTSYYLFKSLLSIAVIRNKNIPLIIHNVYLFVVIITDCDGPLIIVCTHKQMNQRITHQTIG